jgi:RNA-binding protein YhbY
MSTGAVRFQIGKAGVTPAVITQLNRLLEHYKQIRISLLPSSGRTRTSMQTTTDALIALLAYPCNYRIIGFTIVLRKRSLDLKSPK